MNGTSMAMPIPLGPVFNPNVKDSRWLTLEVCREFTRNKCTRSDQECKFAHPPPHVEVQNGRVTCCFDSIKGKCQRKDPPCKYLHPPQHLKEQLLQNGRNNLILRNLTMQHMLAGAVPSVGVMPTVVYEPSSNGKATTAGYPTTVLPSQYPLLVPGGGSVGGPVAHPVPLEWLLGGASSHHRAPHQMNPYTFNPYLNATSLAGGLQGIQGMDNSVSVPVTVSTGTPSQVHTGGLVPTAGGSMSQKVPRADRLESSPVVSVNSGTMSNTWNGHQGHASPSENVAPAGCGTGSYNPIYFQQSMGAMPSGMVPMVKRPAIDGKSGMAMYQPTGTTAYQQALAAMQLQQQYVPVTIAGHPPGMPRF